MEWLGCSLRNSIPSSCWFFTYFFFLKFFSVSFLCASSISPKLGGLFCLLCPEAETLVWCLKPATARLSSVPSHGLWPPTAQPDTLPCHSHHLVCVFPHHSSDYWFYIVSVPLDLPTYSFILDFMIFFTWFFFRCAISFFLILCPSS